MKKQQLLDTLLPWFLIVSTYGLVFGALVAIQQFRLITFTPRVVDLPDLWTSIPMVALIITLLLSISTIVVWSNISSSAKLDQFPQAFREVMRKKSLRGLLARGRGQRLVAPSDTSLAEMGFQLGLPGASALMVVDEQEQPVGLVTPKEVVSVLFTKLASSAQRQGDDGEAPLLGLLSLIQGAVKAKVPLQLEQILSLPAEYLTPAGSVVQADHDMSVYDALELMLSRRLTELLVVDKGTKKALGTVHLLDLVSEVLPDLELAEATSTNTKKAKGAIKAAPARAEQGEMRDSKKEPVAG